MHVATGAGMGVLTRSRSAALVAGPFLHVWQDELPHEDIPSRRFEIASGVAAVAALAWRRGLFHPATIGALAASAPDLEHIFPWLRPDGKELFHRGGGTEHTPALSVKLQLACAAAVVVGLLVSPSDATT